MSRQKSGIRLNPTDFYPTPQWCYENLDIDWSKFTSAHEPCRGDGRIQSWLLERGIPTTYSEINEGLDFFDYTKPTDLIFTNPPFSLAQEFVDHSLQLANTVIMLMRINFLGSIKRHEWWNTHIPTSIHVLSKRPSFTGSGTDATEYCWYVWDKTDRLPRGIFFVPLPSKQQVDRDNELAKKALNKG